MYNSYRSEGALYLQFELLGFDLGFEDRLHLDFVATALWRDRPAPSIGAQLIRLLGLHLGMEILFYNNKKLKDFF